MEEKYKRKEYEGACGHENDNENENCFSEWLVVMEYLIENVSDNGLRPMPPPRLDIMKMNFQLSIPT